MVRVTSSHRSFLLLLIGMLRRMASVVFLASVMCVSLASGAARADATKADATHGADRKAIEAIILAQDAAWNAGDADAYGAKMQPDATFTNIVGIFFVGRDAFVANIRDILQGIFKGSTNRQTIQSIRFVTPTIAVVDTISALGGMTRVPVGAEAPGGVMHSRPEQVMVKGLKGWEITSFHNVTINPRFLPKELMTPP